jgi:hypothetical protein
VPGETPRGLVTALFGAPRGGWCVNRPLAENERNNGQHRQGTDSGADALDVASEYFGLNARNPDAAAGDSNGYRFRQVHDGLRVGRRLNFDLLFGVRGHALHPHAVRQVVEVDRRGVVELDLIDSAILDSGFAENRVCDGTGECVPFNECGRQVSQPDLVAFLNAEAGDPGFRSDGDHSFYRSSVVVFDMTDSGNFALSNQSSSGLKRC